MPLHAALPGKRFQYDEDGTRVVYRVHATDTWKELTLAQKVAMLNENADAFSYSVTGAGQTGTIAFAFPEVRDLAGFFIAWAGWINASSGTTPSLQVSTDTTNGEDGTWTDVATVIPNKNADLWRSSITALASAGIRGLRYNVVSTNNANLDFRSIHFYGTYVPAGLAIWDPTLDQAASPSVLDFDVLSQGEVATKTFRVSNRHATLTASTITLDAVPLSETMDLEFSIGGGAYAASLALGNLGPGITSGVITARRTVPGTETARPQAVRVKAAAGSWA